MGVSHQDQMTMDYHIADRLLLFQDALDEEEERRQRKSENKQVLHGGR